ncbi:MAG: aromatic amino acid transport family protein [Pseudomonadota bacterium]|nr:aromatic amino acid transport family protein [Pseudomonadota bacterium]
MLGLNSEERSGASIVAGTAIGASMLSLPFISGVGGFIPACLIMVTCYLFAIITLLLFLEVTFYCSDTDANIISMAHMHLGKAGEVITWFCFLFLLYIISTSYISGGAELLESIVTPYWEIDTYICMIIFTVIFGLVAFQGVALLDKINQVLLLALLLSYAGLIIVIGPETKISYLSGGKPIYLISSIPITIAAFASHFVVPSLRKNFSANLTSIKKMLWIGSTIPLAVYLVYQYLIVALLPFDGPDGLFAIAKSASPLSALQKTLASDGATTIPLLMNVFSNCAILTSFLGVVLALSDFLEDGLGLAKYKNPQLICALLTLGPPLLISIIVPKESSGFLLALDLSGLLVTFLFGILPVIMVWKARYVEKLSSVYTIPGGKVVLVVIFAVSLFVIFGVFANTFGYLPSPRG